MTLIDLLREDGFSLKSKTRGEYAGPCPFCGGHDRFCVWPHESDGKGRYWCRQCETNGDTITYLLEYRKLSFQEAQKVTGMPTDPPKSNTKPKNRPNKKKTFQVIMPVPDDAPAPTAHYQLGTSDQKWIYRDAQGRLNGYVCRWNRPPDEEIKAGSVWAENPAKTKEIRPLVFGRTGPGKKAWRFSTWPDPRPLYGLDRLAARPEAPVIITEGEKAADAAEALFPDCVAVTSPGGSGNADKAGWACLENRHVLIAPDQDKPGRKYADEVYRQAQAAGAAKIDLLDFPYGHQGNPEHLAPEVRLGTLLQGADLADMLAEGWTSGKLADFVKPKDIESLFVPYPVPEEKGDNGQDEQKAATPAATFEVRPDGTYALVSKIKNNRIFTEETWISSPLYIDAWSRSDNQGEWGRYLRWKDPDGHTHRWPMPAEMLSGDGQNYRAELLSQGLLINHKGRNLLHDYLMHTDPGRRVICVNRTGWHGEYYVLPDATIGRNGGESVVFQNPISTLISFETNGTLQEWKENIGVYSRGNSRIIFAIAAALAPVVIGLVKTEGGGFNIRGPSSIGKTTMIRVAGSVWGNADYIKSWRATANGIEWMAAGHNDALLCLDEVGQVSAREAGECAYMLASGMGKARMNKNGGARPISRWRTIFLSTGEISIVDKMQEAGYHTRAGQEVRILDIPADAGAGLGLFENRFDFQDGAALADHLVGASKVFYGVASRAFIQAVIEMDRSHLEKIILKDSQQFVDEVCPVRADGQVIRAAERFSIVAIAGTLAAKLGILPVEPEDARQGIARCFKDWLDYRGGDGPLEIKRGLEQVRLFFQLHGKSRFEMLEDRYGGDSTTDRPVINRCGYYKDGFFLVFPEVFRKEICKGLDSREISRTLAAENILIPDSNGKFQSVFKDPETRSARRIYRISSDILGDDGDAARLPF